MNFTPVLCLSSLAICVWVYTCAYACMCTQIITYIRTKHACISYIRAYIPTYTYIYTYTHTYKQDICICIYIYIQYLCVYLYMCIHMSIHTNTRRLRYLLCKGQPPLLCLGRGSRLGNVQCVVLDVLQTSANARSPYPSEA